MKKTKIIIPALGLLLLSTAASVTGTVAWFAVNGSVTAEGMTVAAKTDNAYLIISAGTTLGGNATTADVSANFTDIQLKPVKPMAEWTSSNVSGIETVTNWGTASSSDPSNANASAALTALANTATLLGNGNYVMKQSYMVGLLANSAPAASPLRIESVTVPANTGITVVVVCGSNVYTHAATDNDVTGETLALATAVTTTGVQIDTYIYIDGSNANVYTNNATNLHGTVELGFTIDA